MSTPYLDKLGITTIEQLHTPDVHLMPLLFSPNAQSLWEQSILELKPTDDSIEDWSTCIHRFLELCEESSTYPFAATVKSSNNYIDRCLKDARNSIVKFLDSGILDQCTVRSVSHEVKLTPSGFVVSVRGVITPRDLAFENFLVSHPFPNFPSQQVAGKYAKDIGDGVTMLAYKDLNKWYIGYDIAVIGFPDIPGNLLPSRKELGNFILRVMFMPILRSTRPANLAHRLL